MTGIFALSPTVPQVPKDQIQVLFLATPPIALADRPALLVFQGSAVPLPVPGVTISHKGKEENVAGVVGLCDGKAKGEATASREQETETFWGHLVSVVQNLCQELRLGLSEFNSQTCKSESDLATGSLSSCSQGW